MRPLLRFVRNVAVAIVALFSALARAVARPRPIEWVFYELDGGVSRGDPERLPSWAWRLPRGARVRTLAELARELTFLRELPALQGVVVRLGDMRAGPALRAELRRLFADFRTSGKRVVFHAEALDTRGYWLASAGEVWLVPRGRLELAGFAAGSFAGASALRRIGVVLEVIRAGTFKSAGELFGADRVSDAQKQQLGELVGDLWDAFVADVSAGRKLDPERVRDLVNEGPCHARAAKERGLVDELAYADEVRDRLGRDGKRARLGPFGAVFAATGAGTDWRPLRDKRPVIARVDVEGTISGGKVRRSPLGGVSAGSETLVKLLTALRREKSIKAVVLRIDSRGGSALASDLIWRAAKRLAAEKPVVAFLDDVAASGGYYIAAAAGRIVASPVCITGSIGVFSVRPDASGALAKLGVDAASVKRGAHADLLSVTEPLDEAGRAILQRDVLETYEDFLNVVAEGRALPMDRVRELAEGHVYLAPRAQGLGLVDVLGSLDDAVEEAARAAKLATWRVAHVKPPRTGWRELLASWREGGAWAVIDLWRPRGDVAQAAWIGEHPGA